MRIKKIDITPEMNNLIPIRVKDIGCGSRILVLKKYSDGTYLSCLERDGNRINFTRSKAVYHGSKPYIAKSDGTTPKGTEFKRYIPVDGIHYHRRVRTADTLVHND